MKENPGTPLGKHCFGMGWDCSLYFLMFAMAINNYFNWREMTTLNCTCLARVLRNPTPKIATMRLVGIGTSQVRVGVPRPKFLWKHCFCNVVLSLFRWQDVSSSDIHCLSALNMAWMSVFIGGNVIHACFRVWPRPPQSPTLGPSTFPHIFHVSSFMV